MSDFKKKILIVTTVSGTMNFFEDLICSLLEKGYEIHLACNTNNLNIRYPVNTRNIFLHHIDFSRSILDMNNIRAISQVNSLLSKYEFEIIHTHTPIASAIVRLSKIKNKQIKKLVYTAHGFHFYKDAPKKNWIFYYPIEKICSYYTDVLITINEEDYILAKKKFKKTKTYLFNGPGVDKNKIISESINSDLSRKDFGLEEKDFVLIFGGEYNNNKNQILLLEAMKKIKEKTVSNIKLLLVGKGSNFDNYSKFIKEHELEDYVSLLGYRNDLKQIIQLCDVGISSSIREGLGLFLVECLVLNKPIIATDNRGSREIVINRENGLLVKFDVNDMVDSILELYKNEDLYSKMSRNCHKGLNKFYSHNINERIIDIYES